MSQFIKVNIVMISIGFGLLLGNAEAASFECGMAKTKAEKLICGSEELSSMDEKLEDAYIKGKKRTAEPGRYKREQRKWLKKRDHCMEKGTEALQLSCMKDEYTKRIQALSGTCWDHIAWRAHNSTISGRTWPMCRIVLENLNRFCYMPRSVMLDPPIDPGITSLKTVTWKAIEPMPNLDWVGDAYMYRNYRSEGEPDEWGKDVVMRFLNKEASAGKVKMWEAHFDLTNDDVEDVVRKVKTEDETTYEDEGLRFSGIGMVLINKDTSRPYVFGSFQKKTFIFSGKPIINAGTTYLLRSAYAPGHSNDDVVLMELMEPFSSSGTGGLTREQWEYGEKRVCTFVRDGAVSEGW